VNETLHILKEMTKNAVMANRALAGLRQRSGGGRTTGFLDVPAALAHTHAIIEHYRVGLRAAGCDDGWWAGRRVLEVGPGATLGVQLLQVAAGADAAHAVDRFSDLQYTRAAAEYYERLLADLPEPGRSRAHEEYLPEPGVPGFAFQRIAYFGECRLETAPSRLAPGYDLAVSHFAIEHVADLQAGIRALACLLRPGGLCVLVCHLVSLGGVYNYETEPLRLLHYSDTTWNLMFSNRGGSNRVRASGYREALAASGFEIVAFDTLERLPPGDLQRVRPHLAPRFRALDDDDLSIVKFRLVARRSSHRTGVAGEYGRA